MKPSGTDRGQSWIAQFEVDDQPAATTMLDSIRFVDQTVMLQSIKRILELRLDDARQHHAPVAILPVRSREDFTQIVYGPLPNRPSFFKDFDINQGFDGSAGSEAVIANLIRDVKRNDFPRIGIRDPVTFEHMMRNPVRRMILVTDYIGSGKQIAEFADLVLAHPTFRSWISLGLLQLEVVTFAATRAGISVASRIRSVGTGVFVHEAVPTIADVSSPAVRENWERLCHLYAKRGKLGKSPLGFDESGGLYASAISVPNNLPAILIRRSRHWIPFFDGRTASSSLANSLGNYQSAPDLADLVRTATRSILADRFDDQTVRPEWQPWLALLAVLPGDVDALAVQLGITGEEFARRLNTLMALGLIDSRHRLTKRGVNTLRFHRRKRRITTAALAGSEEPYYPQSLR